MNDLRRILVMGASGSGTTTLGRALAEQLHWAFIDTDDFYWLPTLLPFSTKRPREERINMAMAAIAEGSAVLSGSLCGWGTALENAFDLVIFLTVSTDVRLRRLVARETARWGKVDPEFIEWAGLYDVGTREGRNRALHEQWLAAVKCPILRLDGEQPIGASIAAIIPQFGATLQHPNSL